MARKGMTIDEAAERLGVSERTLRSYIQKGFLSATKHRGDRKHYLNPLEVEEFRKDREEARGTSIISKGEWLQMRAQLRRLQSQMDVMMRMLDARNEPLRMSNDYAQELFLVCVKQLQNTGWSIGELEPWVEIFMRLDENDIETIRQATGEKKAWKPFLQLCVSMTAYVGSHPEYTTTLELQMIHRSLAECRRRLRVSALIYSEMHGDVDIDIRRYALADAPSSLTDSLKSLLTRSKNSG